MRIDVITIFPEYLQPLELSLIGRARRDGLLDLHVHHLRSFASDRHATVDDTPVGGGAGMVMKPEPWADAFAHVLAQQPDKSPLIIFPNPAGEPFQQRYAQDYCAEDWIVFACGRYEGIDERVYHYLQDQGVRMQLHSLGDYVLNGGEVAVLAMTEAIVRLVPGVLGNPESILEESHSGGLLEYPIFTKPASWTSPDGIVRDVPEVLLSGNHARIAAWRHEQAVQRTRERRPDLLGESSD